MSNQTPVTSKQVGHHINDLQKNLTNAIEYSHSQAAVEMCLNQMQKRLTKLAFALGLDLGESADKGR